MNQPVSSKVPAVTLGFWIIKMLATTLGETGGDTVTMTMNLGYLRRYRDFPALLVVLVVAQIAAQRFHPFLYWATIVASTTAGTTMADFADRSLGIGYTGGAALLLFCVLALAGALVPSAGTISVDTVSTPRVESLLLGDDHLLADARHRARRLDGRHAASAFSAARWCSSPALARSRAAYFYTGLSRVLLFWAAFILTRPLGATRGRFLDKPRRRRRTRLQPAARLGDPCASSSPASC